MPDLKGVFAQVLADETAGPIANAILRTPAVESKALARARADADSQYNKLVSDAQWTISGVVDDAMDMKGMESSDAWPRALQPFLRDVGALLEMGPLVEGPELAWDAVFELAELCMYDWEDGDARVQEGEECCDKFHDEVDVYMLKICKAQKENGNMEWLSEDRAKEVVELQNKPQEPCRYRYKKTLKFLEEV